MCLEGFSIGQWEKEKIIKQGIEQGEIKGKKEIIKNMLKNGFDNETVSKISNLSIEKIIEIKKTL